MKRNTKAVNFAIAASRPRTCFKGTLRGLVSTAALVPEMTRFGEPIREWLAQGSDIAINPFKIFDGNDLVSLVTPDLAKAPDSAKVLLFLSFALAFFLLEGNQLILDFLQEKNLEDIEDASLSNVPKTPEENTARERKRGLGWLALATAVTLWCTGSVNLLIP